MTRVAERRSAPFESVVVGIRWTTLAIGLALTPSQTADTRTALAWGLALLTYHTWRTVKRLDLNTAANPGHPSAARTVPFLVDVGVAALAVVSTGYWSSPFAFCLITGLVASGFAFGIRFAASLATAAAMSVTLPQYLVGGGAPLLTTGQWVAELALVAVLAGYGRRLFGEGERLRTAALSRVSQLAEANDLLVSLHRVAQTLPASFDLEQVLSSTIVRIRSVIASDVTAVVVRDESTGAWSVVAGEGTRVGRTMTDDELPASLSAAASSSVASLAVCVEPGQGLGPEMLSHSGLYAPLRARGRLVGLIALEHHAPGYYGRRELQILDGFVETAALAIDNARWFMRLRSMGADEERLRIARDMHDGIGQSLAGVAFALDRLRSRMDDEAGREQVEQLRGLVRSALGEVRDTLADLRTDVSDERGMADTIESFVQRVRERTPVQLSSHVNEIERLPVVQEREMWRVAQEAVTNAERHSRADHVSIRWYCDGTNAALTVADDGNGFVLGTNGRPDSYGLAGMQERADGIRAALTVDTAPGKGTMVRCVLGSPPPTA